MGDVARKGSDGNADVQYILEIPLKLVYSVTEVGTRAFFTPLIRSFL